MSGQYELSLEDKNKIMEIIKKEITCYKGDLFEDNDVSIQFKDKDNAYIQMN